MTRSFYLESLGCAKNQVDSEYLIALLERHDLDFTDDPDRADCVIVNTCGFIQSAKEESINTVLGFRERYPKKKILLVGCLALRYWKELEQELGEVDGVWGNIRDPGFPGFVLGLLAPARRPATGQPLVRESDPVERNRLLSFPGSVYIKISEGCGNRCTYCAIPLIRGALNSRGRAEIIRELRSFIDRGIREINLIAQDTTAFGSDRGAPEIIDLLSEAARLPGDYWLRLLYLHPDHFPEELTALCASSRLLPYFDIPFQHASGRILAAMNRRGNADTYAALVDRIRNRLPEAVLRTTFLVGFPGESDADFKQLVDFQNSIQPQWAGVFAYSSEEGTPASKLKPRVPVKIARERKRLLEEQQTVITGRWLDGLTGSTTDVLCEESVAGENLMLGRAWFQAPEVDGLVVTEGLAARPGDVCRVKITARANMDLRGTPADG
jgi:ribosomal protein S12 methylthiotransferase